MPDPAARSRAGVDAGGAVAVAVKRLPYSAYASDAARTMFTTNMDKPPATADMLELRAHYDRFNDKLADEMRAAYPVTVTQETIGGVSVQRVVSEAATQADTKRGLLINLHGGGFMWGAGSGALVEAIPIAAASKLPVVTVDYRLAPEHAFPAASDDVCAVYETLLRDHAPASIGIYGASAGAALTAQTIAMLDARAIPLPGAIAMLAGAGMDFGGDSAYLAGASTGAPPSEAPPLSFFNIPYFRGVDPNDPLAIPVSNDALLSRFPPSLLLAGSRDFAASAVTQFHRRLVANGVDARLFMFDGLWHAFQIFCALPESQETYRILAAFFTRNLRFNG